MTMTRPAARTSGARERRAVPPLIAVAVLVLVASFLTDARAATAHEWLIVGLLGAVAVAAAVITRRFKPPDTDAAPPWSVHTTWLLPAALLAPPIGFIPLVAFSVALGLTRRVHSWPARFFVASITVTTTAEIHWAAQLIDDVLIAGLLGVVVLWVTGVVYALLAASVLTGPSGTATWLDYRWSFVQLGCSFAGLLTAAAIDFQPYAALAALAPVLMAEFSLSWPELERYARVDAKTGLPNARAWEDRSRDLISAASLREVPVAVVMVDIDHFKVVNDDFGHLVGDEVLQGLAGTLRSQVNPGDVLGRFGGEEFVITLFGLSATAARSVAERIRAAIAAQEHSSRARLATDSNWYDADEAARPAATFAITVTIGLASSDSIGHDLAALLLSADEALAEGKAAGRDRVQVSSPNGSAAGESRPGPLRVATDKRSWTHVAGQQRRTRRSR